MSVHPLHIEVFDLKDNRSVQVYPYKHDPLRSQYSSLIAPHVSEDWCRINNARCDASNFDVTLDIPIAVNESAKTFGFEATFDAAGFGDDAQAAVASKRVAYMFSQYAGKWEHRQYEVTDLDHLFHLPSVHALVSQRPRAPFESPVR